MELDNQTQNHKEIQKLSEWHAIEKLTPFIEEVFCQTNSEAYNIEETEEPDFVFCCHEKSIGVEVIECHPSTSKKKKTMPLLWRVLKRKYASRFQITYI